MSVEINVKLVAVRSIDNEYIPLKHIESVNMQYTDKADELVAKLKDDCVVKITTLSGKEHLLSMRQHIDLVKEDIHTVEEMLKVIFDNWLNKVG